MMNCFTSVGTPAHSAPIGWSVVCFCFSKKACIENIMAEESEKQNTDLQVMLKPFYQRASEAEERLSRLEISLASKKDAEDQELSNIVSELQSKLEEARSAQISERKEAEDKIQALAAENSKLKYRIIHLVRALEEADKQMAEKKSSLSF